MFRYLKYLLDTGKYSHISFSAEKVCRPRLAPSRSVFEKLHIFAFQRFARYFPIKKPPQTSEQIVCCGCESDNLVNYYYPCFYLLSINIKIE